MSLTSDSLTRFGQPYGIEKRPIHNRGNGLLATHAFAPREQIFFVDRPLILALETSHLQSTCYGCLRSDDAQKITHNSKRPESVDLKTCTGCRIVRFCNKTCQRTAWKEYHKHECPIYARLQPRILPGPVRGIMRLLLQHQHGILLSDDWDQVFTLESHLEQLRIAGGQKWENILLMTKALKTYSNSPQPMDTIIRMCCILMVNSFALTNPTMDPIGIVMHPLPALINHSCDPNAYVRFDMSSETSVSPPPKIHHGSISVHALRPINAGEELRITYIDATTELSRRQSELKQRYFFTCDCPACKRIPSTLTDPHSAIVANAEEILTTASAQPPAQLPGYLSRIQAALASLSSMSPPHPITSYPSPQLRHQLILALIASKDFFNAMRHNMVLHFKVDSVLYKEDWHPCALVSRWRLLRLVQHRLEKYETGDSPQDSRAERAVLVAVSGVLVRGLAKDVLSWRTRDEGQTEMQNPEPVGQFEMMVAQASEQMTHEFAATGMAAFERAELAGDWQTWCRNCVDGVLLEEAKLGSR